MEILNYTPNTINIYSGADLDPKTKKWKGGYLINTFPSVGILNARMEEITEYIKEDGIIFKRTRIVSHSCDVHPILDQDSTYIIFNRHSGLSRSCKTERMGYVPSADCWRRRSRR